ncbi:MAG: hypothetical protein IJM20_06270 [Clostridia bacterium]|nr:hypothetical protein [Clostridia bacterium]
MKEKSVLTTFTETLEKNRALRTVLTGALILAAFILFLTSGVFRSCGKTAEEPTQETSGNIGAQTAELEKRLEGMLSSMAGVGRVKVMLTLDSTEEQILATNSRNQTAQSGSSEETRPATVNTGGGENPIVLTEKLPRVRGVIVSAEGAGNFSVRMNIITAVSTVLGIDQSRVEVFVMAG